MSDEVSDNLTLPFLQPSQAQKHVTHNEALERLDILVQLTVEAFGATEPPSLPEPGEVFALGSGATGAWAGHDGELAAWVGEGWQFIAPRTGWRAGPRDGGALRLWDGADWVTPLDGLDRLGINTSADSTNRLAVAAPATLLNHEDGDHRLMINKAQAGDTAAVLFQSGFTGHAEFGLSGQNDFTVNVSDDGSDFTTAIFVNADDGATTLRDLRAATINVDDNFRVDSNGRLFFGDSLDDDDADDALTAGGAQRALNMLDTEGLIKLIRVSDSNGSGMEFQQVDPDDFSSLVARYQVVGENGDVFFRNLTDGPSFAQFAFFADNDFAAHIASENTSNGTAFSLALGSGSGSASDANQTIRLEAQTGTIRAENTSIQGIDYAELFRNATGAEIAPGTILALDCDAVRPAGPGDEIAGVVSHTHRLLGGEHFAHWQGRYLRDEWGREKWEDVEVTRGGTAEFPEAVTTTMRRRVENPDWDPAREQLPRAERPGEWTPVGLVGQVLVRVAAEVAPGDRVAPGEDGIGVVADAPTGLRAMRVTAPHDAARGCAIAWCMLNVRVWCLPLSARGGPAPRPGGAGTPPAGAP